MPYTDFLYELEKAGLSIRAFAGLIGIKPNSISNYARTGELPTHIALIAVLVAEMGTRGIDYRRIMTKVELSPKKPRGGAKPGHFGGDPQSNFDLLMDH
jgi:transcriptional regulator with XRE-family HTH domain